MSAFRRLLGFGLVTILVAACSSDSKSGDDNTPGSEPDAGNTSAGGSSGGDGSGGSSSGLTHGDFNGDCSTTNWGYEDDDCWACMCAACADTLNKCNGDCIADVKCAWDKQALANVMADIPCEIRASGNLCLQDPKAQAAAQPFATFDGCLLGPVPDKGSDFRACDTVCKNTYSGDVCQRFPM